jgi:hypothetical protein
MSSVLTTWGPPALLPRRVPGANVVVRGWWPRWWFRPAAGGSADISISGRSVARIGGRGPRQWQVRLPVGEHRLTITDLGRTGRVMLDQTVMVGDSALVFVQYCGSYRRAWFGRLAPSRCWVEMSKPRATWFAPLRAKELRNRRRQQRPVGVTVSRCGDALT